VNVRHDLENLTEGEGVVLTLADTGVSRVGQAWFGAPFSKGRGSYLESNEQVCQAMCITGSNIFNLATCISAAVDHNMVQSVV
jgi:hypothetical protein